MFNIFKPKKQPRFYYPELKPAERIEKILLEFILPELEPLGFRFLKSELCFVRAYGDFENEISFQKNKWNKANEVCAFKPVLVIYSRALPKYLGTSKVEKRRWLLGDPAGEIEGWSDKYFDGYYDLAAHDNHDLVESFKTNLLGSGMDYFNRFKTLREIIDHYLQNSKRFTTAPTLFDLCQMNNDRESAVAILSWSEEYGKNTSNEMQQYTLKELELRKLELKNWVQ